jgi:ribose-phosphate pyrophosphokinase
MRVFLTDSVQHLRKSFKKQGVEVGWHESYAFVDRECGYRLRNEVAGASVGIAGSILPNPQSLFDLMALYHLARENGAQETTLLVPYLGYARQDRPSRSGEGSIGIMVVELLQKMKPSHLILIDVHSNSLRNILKPLTREISALPLFAKALSKRPPDVIVSPDGGYLSRAKQLSVFFDPRPDVAMIDKVRPRPNVAIARELHGNVRGKDIVLLDDIIDTGRTLAEAVRLVFREGARTVRIAATHGIFSGDARRRLSRLSVDEILITNTLPQLRHAKIRILDIVPLIVNAL